MKRDYNINLLNRDAVDAGEKFNAFVELQSPDGMIKVGGRCLLPKDVKLGDQVNFRITERGRFESWTIIGLDWKIEPQLPDLKMETALYTITYSTLYNDETFYVDIVKSDDLYEAYLYSQFCGYKKYMFGMLKSQICIDGFIKTVSRDLYEHIEFYLKFEDNLDEFLDALDDEKE